MNSFRIISYIEGLSYLVLVFVAMPLKYLGGNLIIMKILGMTHGVLFILFAILLFLYKRKENIENSLIWDYFIYSLSPFGFFLIESRIKKNKN